MMYNGKKTQAQIVDLVSSIRLHLLVLVPYRMLLFTVPIVPMGSIGLIAGLV
jgi:hypothetical protein